MIESTLRTYVVEDPGTRRRMYEIYQLSFQSADDFAAQDQACYDEVTFNQALLDSEYVKFIVYLEEKIFGFFLLTNNLTKARIAYCNDRFLKRKFPKFTSEGRVYYVTSICILPEMQSKGLGISLLKSVCEFGNEKLAAIAYDYSENKNPDLTKWVQFVGKELNINIIEIPLDRQVYSTVYEEKNGCPE